MQSTRNTFSKILEKFDHVEQINVATVKDLRVLRELMIQLNTDSVLWMII